MSKSHSTGRLHPYFALPWTGSLLAIVHYPLLLHDSTIACSQVTGNLKSDAKHLQCRASAELYRRPKTYKKPSKGKPCGDLSWPYLNLCTRPSAPEMRHSERFLNIPWLLKLSLRALVALHTRQSTSFVQLTLASKGDPDLARTLLSDSVSSTP